LVFVFALAAVVTAVLSLDATVVLLTPVVFATASRMGVRPKPHAYACTHLANAGSLLLPVSNLTNLLAMSAAGLTFVGFAGLMALPWVAVIAVEYAAFRIFFASDLSIAATNPEPPDVPPLPKFSAIVLALTLAGFVAASFVHVEAAWVALAGALVMLVRALRLKQVTAKDVPGFINLGFLAFVLSLGVVVAAVVEGGLGAAIGAIVPQGDTLVALLLWAGLAALLANVVNNLPAVLVLLPFAATSGVSAVLAVLIGVNVGPNLTYVGSLATLLWRRIAQAHDHETPIQEFTLLGLLSTPVAIVVGVLALWASLLITGGAG
jgi:arsenical pump membrane protein